MALIFSPLVRTDNGKLPLSIGTGVVPSHHVSQGMKISSSGFIYAVLDGTIHHYSHGLPFDINGRLVVSQNIPQRYDMAVPLTSTGAVAGGS